MTTPTATPTTPAAWEEYVNTVLATPESANAAFADGSFRNALTGYINSSHSSVQALKQEMIEQATAATVELFKRNGVDDDNTRRNALSLVGNARQAAHRDGVLYSATALGSEANGVFGGIGDFVGATLARQGGRATDEQIAMLRAHADRYKNYSGKVPTEGGYLVPEEFRSDILSIALERAVVRPRAKVVPMSSAKLRWPAVDFNTEVGEVYGGITMFWLDEGQTVPDTSASFSAIELVLSKLGGLASVPNELVHDARALTAWLMLELPNALYHFEDVGFMKGNGVAKPLGALHPDNPAMIVVPKETNQAAASITWNNVLAMFSRLLPESYANAAWVITPDAIPEVFTMALPVGTGGSAVMIGDGGGPGRLANTMLGLPIIFSRKTPGILGTQGDISLVDFSNYVIGDGQEMRFDTSPHSSFRSDKTDFRIIERIDGQPGLLGPLTPENNGPTLSSFVQLATRS